MRYNNYMKKAAIIVAVVLTASMVDPVFAVPITDAQLGNIQINCDSNKLHLDKNYKEIDSNNKHNLHIRYERVEENMKKLNKRLVNMALVDKDIKNEFTNQQSDFSREVDDFEGYYKDYAGKMEELIRVNCKEHPYDFYNKLETVRLARSKVSNSIKRIEDILHSHNESIAKLREIFNAGNE